MLKMSDQPPARYVGMPTRLPQMNKVGVVTLFEIWPREADTALFRQAVHSRLPTRPLPGVDGFEFILRSGWSGMDEEVSNGGEDRQECCMSRRPTGNPVAFTPVFGTAGENSPPRCSSVMLAVLHVRHELAFGRPVGAQFVGDHTLWRQGVNFSFRLTELPQRASILSLQRRPPDMASRVLNPLQNGFCLGWANPLRLDWQGRPTDRAQSECGRIQAVTFQSMYR